MECTNNRVFDTSGLDVKSAEDAWNAIQKADEEKDLDDFKLVSGDLMNYSRHKTVLTLLLGYQGLYQGCT